jgi:hypothetical protein
MCGSRYGISASRRVGERAFLLSTVYCLVLICFILLSKLY